MNWRKASLAAAFAASVFASPAFSAGDEIRQLVIYSRPQAAQPQEFQAVQLIAQEWRKLGLDVKVDVMPWEQMSDIVWYNRDKWDMSAWQMVGRPERGDPDELTYNLFHSSTAEKGYNFVGYINPAYDEIASAQRKEIDPAKRQALVFKAQEIVAQDQPIMNLVHPRLTYAYNKDVWDEKSIVDQAGVGIKNFWTFVGMTPLGDKKDILLNSADNVQSINPLYISGGTDSWITELVWDRLLRVGPDGLPKPWLAEGYNWVDDKTIELTVRNGVKWHDGTPLTLDDVIFSFERQWKADNPWNKYVEGASWEYFAGMGMGDLLEKIEKVDDLTVRFTLKRKEAPFLANVAMPFAYIMSKEYTDKLQADGKMNQLNQMPLGTGPFQFVGYQQDAVIRYKANPDYW
ncbi:ABC transporter substrate-binding protein, partial [Rhizobiaceae sp. 2RAB30]